MPICHLRFAVLALDPVLLWSVWPGRFLWEQANVFEKKMEALRTELEEAQLKHIREVATIRENELQTADSTTQQVGWLKSEVAEVKLVEPKVILKHTMKALPPYANWICICNSISIISICQLDLHLHLQFRFHYVHLLFHCKSRQSGQSGGWHVHRRLALICMCRA